MAATSTAGRVLVGGCWVALPSAGAVGYVQVKEAIAAVIARFGKLTTLVNCAGIAPAARVVGKKGAHPLDLFQKVTHAPLPI